jgi:sugar phosphate isomerase/epimerase
MTVKLYRHAWGAVGDGGRWPNLATFLDEATPGYDGVEMPLFVLDADPAGRDVLLESIREKGLDFLPMAMTFTSEPYSPEAHLAALRPQLETAAAIGFRRVNAHAGMDGFDDAAAASFLTESIKMATDLGIDLLHETHRSRILYNPWRTARMVEEVEGLRLTADYSHWVVVAERIPFDAAAAFATCAPAVGHIHSRVGHAEGPQVADPSDPTWANELAAHEGWWDAIVAAAKGRGDETSITPEFGPPPYMPTMPFTGEPLADLADVVEWMRARLRERYAD